MRFYKTREINVFFLISKEKKTLFELKISRKGKNKRFLNFKFLTKKVLKITRVERFTP